MKPGLGRLIGALVSLVLYAGQASACPCSDDAGGGAFITSESDKYALVLVASTRRALGNFDVRGRFHALSANESETAEELLLRIGLRQPTQLEWQAELGAASYRFHTALLSERQTGLGDAILRARYEVRNEEMPHHSVRLPAVSVGALVRVPLGAIASSASSGFGSGDAQLGLGAWELGAGFDVSHSILRKVDLWLGSELAYRLPDDALGRSRQLGPRWDLAVGGRFGLLAWLSANLALESRLTGDVTLAGRKLDGTSARLLTVVVGAAARDERTGFRSSFSISLAPPIDGLSAGATSATALGFSVGIVR